jgi:hypothetical protein
MSKYKIIIALGCLLTFAFLATSKKELPKTIPQPEIKKEVEIDPLSVISAEEMKKEVNYLTSPELEGRMSGKKGNILAAKHIKETFESFGLQTMYQRFPVERRNAGPLKEKGDNYSQNILAWIPGNDPTLKDDVIVIGAHMDHIGYGPVGARDMKDKIHPGADDNASGTAALLQVAKAFSTVKSKIKRTVVFMSFSGEEMGLIGSRFYVNNPTFPVGKPDINKHLYMVNMDMVGHLKKTTDTTKLSELGKKYPGVEEIITHKASNSDHTSFYNKKIPIAFLNTGFGAEYHTINDTADKLDYEGMKDIASYVFEFTYKKAN